MKRPPLLEKARHLASRIDHTLLKADATAAQIEQLAEEAVFYGFASACVMPARLPLVARMLAGTTVRPCTVAGFPLGATETETKAFECSRAVEHGAREIDMVMAVGALKEGDYAAVERDIRAVVRAAGAEAIVKVILENALLTDEEKVLACCIAEQAGAAFVKTSTGLAGGATVEDIRLMRLTVSPRVRVKASGGIRTRDDAEKLIEAGADRIGTSAGVAIVTTP